MLPISIINHIESRYTIKLAKAIWYKNWELYPILLFATFLRFYKINTGEFDFDQVLIYRLAYDAVHHGLWPVTNCTASLGFANAPGELYLIMIPAALSANPIYGYYLISLLSFISVLITYIFTIRYYGRLASTIATLLYATATIPIYYSRFLWQPNMMYPFVILFMFTLFLGVVERRKGWFGPALILLGILYQTHGATLTLAVPLALALCMAFKTVRWRDLFYGIAGLAIIFFPFMLWQITSHFSDLQFLLTQNAKPVMLNNDAWMLYRLMISPYDLKYPPPNPHFLARIVLPITSRLYDVMCYLMISGCVLALGGVLVLWERQRRSVKYALQEQTRENARHFRWSSIPALPPEACGLLLLCAWQITPIVAMIKHSSHLYPQYMLVVLPGPFILISYSIVASRKCAQLLYARFWTYMHVVVSVVLAGVVVLQLVNSVAILQEYTYGYTASNAHPHFNTLASQQKMLDDAERLAQQHHLKRIFIGVDKTTEAMMLYFSEHMHSPVSVFFSNQCMLLPSPADGPAMLIMSPSTSTSNKIVGAHGARLLERITPLNSVPFRLYELPPAQKDTLPMTTQTTFPHTLQSSDVAYQVWAHRSLFARWTLLHSYPLATNTTYSYHFSAHTYEQLKQPLESTCTFTMAHAGDQLLPSFRLSSRQASPTTLSISTQFYETTPDWPLLGLFHLETHRLLDSKPMLLHTLEGKYSINMNIGKE